MITAAILPWFPIVLAVGVGGRLLGRPRAWFLGVACALFWVALTQASLSAAMWRDGWMIVTLVAGSSAIALMGVWSAHGVWEPVDGSGPRAAKDPGNVSARQVSTWPALVGSPLDRFDEWLCEHRNDADPWPAFGEFAREVLRTTAQASHVQILRLDGDEQELIALHATDVWDDSEHRPARQGIPGHVLTTGRSYLHGDATQGELVHALARESGERIAWCFPVTTGVRRLGVVVVGRLAVVPDRMPESLRLAEQLISLFWRMLPKSLFFIAGGAEIGRAHV